MGGRALSATATGSASASARLELSEPIPDLAFPSGVEQLRASAAFGGDELGMLELPVCDGAVPAAVIADAAADRFSWEVLRRVFERDPYPALRADAPAWLARRGLTRTIAPDEVERLDPDELHDTIGWSVFLQELWGELAAPETFYAPRPSLGGRLRRLIASLRPRRWDRLEVSGELSSLRGPADVLVSVGGAPLGIVPVDRAGSVSGERLRGAITGVGGYELCRLAIREGLLGRRPPVGEGSGLRLRLVEAARDAERREEALGSGPVAAGAPRGGPPSVEASRRIEPAPGWDRLLPTAAHDRPPTLVLARHGPDAAAGIGIGTGASRRAALPAGAVEELLDSARAAGEPVVRPGGQATSDRGRVLYAPELLWRPKPDRRLPARLGRRRRHTPSSPSAGPPAATAPEEHRHRFEEVFAAGEDPWRYTSPYEQTKYELTLSLLPEGRPQRALEVGCAEGHFTAQLAPRVERLTATDISAVALERAARRCAGGANVDFARLDLVADPVPGGFDLVVCSETLYFTGDREGLGAAARKLAAAVAPGGHLLTANAHQVVDDPGSPGFDWGLPFGAKAIGEALAATGSLALVRELRAPLYRVQLFRRIDGGERAPAPEIGEIEQPTEVPARVAATVRWTGGRPAPVEAIRDEPTTARLPILVYHRVAPSGARAGARHRLTPEAFEEQLAYLRSAGFHSVGLDAWRGGMEARQPLPGRRVMITFDDGYRDLAEHAWPLLRRYGFTAVAFVVADEVGGWNRWDDHLGERLPLLDWEELARLRDEGLELGSHSATHPSLTGLSPVEVVREAARSRAEIARRLGAPPLAFAYPYGETDGAVEHLVGATGYRYGLTVRGVRCRLQDRLLAMPRIEVAGDDALPAFLAKLGA